jgi:hypothetical protein
MSSSLAEYLAALEARDEREQAHAVYVNACKSGEPPNLYRFHAGL